jgi:hypothetical protein
MTWLLKYSQARLQAAAEAKPVETKQSRKPDCLSSNKSTYGSYFFLFVTKEEACFFYEKRL